VVIGLGIDIVEVGRISRALQGSDTLAKRVFTEKELEYCGKRKNQYQHYAGRFAAKEAALKALGTGWQEGIRWKDVEIVPDELGKPELNFYRRAKEVFEEAGAQHAVVTITHANEYAVAAVVIEGEPVSIEKQTDDDVTD
jgi:holo-[acyl-carrier protein] synthase